MWSVRRQGGPHQIFVPLVWAQCASNLHVLPRILSPPRSLSYPLSLAHLPSSIANAPSHHSRGPLFHSPLLSLFSLSLSLSPPLLLPCFVSVSHSSSSSRRESNRFAEHRVSAFQRILVPVATCYFRRPIRRSIPSFLPSFLPRERRRTRDEYYLYRPRNSDNLI